MLDTPTFFWSSEPTLHPLYTAVREYLEIKPRIQVLNERCRVFLDLAEILTDSIADTKMSRKPFRVFFGVSFDFSLGSQRHSLTRKFNRINMDYHSPDWSLHLRHLFRGFSPFRNVIFALEEGGWGWSWHVHEASFRVRKLWLGFGFSVVS